VLLLAVPHGLLMLRLLLMAIAGLSTWALLRRLRLATMPAFTGAALFELNGSFAWQAHGPMMPVAFLPLMLLGAEQARTERVPLALVAGVAWSFLSGFPETAALNLLFVAVWCVMRFAQAPDRSRYAITTIGAVTAGLLVAAPAIWPFLQALPWEFLGFHAGAVGEPMTPGNWALLLFPYLFGNVMQGPLHHGLLQVVWTSVGGYTDLVVVALACLALRRRVPEMTLRWMLAAWLVVTVLRAATLQPVMAVFNLLPLLRQARVHVYVVPSWSMALSILAAFTLQDWVSARRPLLWPLLGVGLGAAGALVMARPDMRIMSEILPAWVPIVSILVPCAVLAVMIWLLRSPRIRTVCMGGLVVANAAVLAAVPLLAGAHGRALDDESIRFLQQHAGLGRVVSFGPLVPNYGAMFGIAEISHNYLPVPLNWVNAVQSRLLPDCDGINFHEGAPPDPARFRGELAAYEDMGVRYALTWRPGADLAAEIPGITLAYSGDLMNVWALPEPKPYAEAANCQITGDRATMHAQCERPSILLRRELAWPGWTATVNGENVAVNAQDIFETVALPEGASDVAFRYAPPGILWCWALAAMAMVGVMGAHIHKLGGPGRSPQTE
jgi:hypothetical protein